MATQQKKKAISAKSPNGSRRNGKAWKQGKTPGQRQDDARAKRDRKAYRRYASGIRRLIEMQEVIDKRRIRRAVNPAARTAEEIRLNEIRVKAERGK